MEWAVFGSAIFISFLLIAILGEHLRQKRKIKLREIQQTERLAAMEKGVPMPETNDDIFNEGRVVLSGPEQYRRNLQWFRITSLSIGLFLVFGGLGILIGFELSGDSEFNKMTSLGMLPFMAGFGLLLFYFLTKNQVK